MIERLVRLAAALTVLALVVAPAVTNASVQPPPRCETYHGVTWCAPWPSGPHYLQ